MPFCDVVVTGVAEFTKTYHVEADTAEEAENNYSDGDCTDENYEDDGFTAQVDNVTLSN